MHGSPWLQFAMPGPVPYSPLLQPYPPFPPARTGAEPGGAVAFAPQPQATGNEYTAVFAGDLPADAGALVQAAGGRLTCAVPPVGVLTATSADPEFLARLRARARLAAAGPALAVGLRAPKAGPVLESGAAATPAGADLFQRYQWDIKRVTGGGRSFALGTGSHDVVVGLIDTGIDPNHPDLQRNLLGARNFHPGVATFLDEHGHGTHVAGTICGNGRILGVGPNLGFRAYRVFAATGGALTAWIIAAMVAAADEGVDVLAMSLGGFDVMSRYYIDAQGQSDVADFLAYQRAVRYALQRGCAVVAAAGNDAIDIGNPRRVTDFLNAEYGPYGYVFRGTAREVPGTLAGVLAVSSTGPEDAPAAYSNFGAGAIDLTAPGGDCRRYPAAGWWTDMCVSAFPGGRYAWMAGTSMATPKVAGVVALAMADQFRRTGRKPGPAQAAALVLQAAADIGRRGVDPLYGRGMADALAVLGGR